MSPDDIDPREFYTRPAAMTSVGEQAALVKALPGDPGALAEALHGLVIHEHMTGGYGVTLAEAKEAAETVVQTATPITPAIISYQQTEANEFLKLGLITKKLNVKGIFDLPLNKAIDAKAGIS